ncbi:hypothetical protein [Terriglobus albidus]|uniref:hypothetical protein n=1 Tax=Terriglobus albidus TaxID=1592106 RepID=UPI0021DFF4E4|nr:hypothetical protein [Terriglobus albidus]
MSTKLDMRETDDALIIRAVWKLSLPLRILRIAAELAVGAWVVESFWRGPYPVLAVAAAVSAAIFLVKDVRKVWNGSDVTLTVTQENITSEGLGDNHYSPSSMNRLGCDLTYDAGNGSEDDPYPSGLYTGHTCLLPELTELQTMQIMTAIYARFPDTGTESPVVEDGKTSELISLNLGRTS